MHHIAVDGGHSACFGASWLRFHEALSAGRQFALPDLPVQYADFAIWQRAWLQGETLDQHVAYWKENLREAPAVLKLPTDFPHPAVQRYRGARYEFVLDKYLSKSLHELSRREGVTLFMTMLAAWQVLLRRYSGQEDVVVGVPIAGLKRNQTGWFNWFFCQHLSPSNRPVG